MHGVAKTISRAQPAAQLFFPCCTMIKNKFGEKKINKYNLAKGVTIRCCVLHYNTCIPTFRGHHCDQTHVEKCTRPRKQTKPRVASRRR